MSDYKVISTQEISNSEAFDIISKKESESENSELTYREEKSLDYLKKFSKLTKENFEKAKEELLALEIPRLEEMHINKILDLMPINGTQIRAIVSTSGTVLVDENITKLIDVLNKYR